jgi:hypothetical protein
MGLNLILLYTTNKTQYDVLIKYALYAIVGCIARKNMLRLS